jgi:methionyl-tRNA synthetase
MSATPSRFYITTAIDYPNSVPHMGHAYEKVVADFYARAARLRGVDTRFLVGLDEHGLKIQEAAERAGQAPQAFVDEKAGVFRRLYEHLGISYDDFIRTSEERHHQFARELYEKVRSAGDIYKGLYQGDYCVSCEKAYTKSELIDGKCPVHGTPVSVVREESYFFRLGKYRDPVRAHIEAHPEFILPSERRNEILSRLREEVHDLSISRSTFRWGVPLTDDPSHVLYVWFDALANYVSALRRPEDIFERYWPADCHVIGKDIIWFHSVIWPAMLTSAGLPLPAQVYAHGFILDSDGRKMSKHLGNVVDPWDAMREFSVDALRFYFLRAFASGQDGNFSLGDLRERYHSELANDLGNLVMRISKLVRTRAGGLVKTPGYPVDLDATPTVREYFEHVDAREHHRAVETLWAYIRRTNAYLNEKAPWKITDAKDVEKVLGCAVEALRTIAHLVHPIMPSTSTSIASTLGFEVSTIASLSSAPGGYAVMEASPLFPRRDAPSAPAAETAGAAPAQAGGPTDPFSKLEIRVGKVLDAVDHPNADTLFALTVDLGSERRSICAGLRGHLSAGELAGRTVLVLANLKPAMLRGIESRGMVLATDRRDGKVVPVDPGEAKPGELATVEGIPSNPKAKISKSDFEKAPLEIQGGVVTYRGAPLRTAAGPVRCDAEDGAPVR